MNQIVIVVLITIVTVDLTDTFSSSQFTHAALIQKLRQSQSNRLIKRLISTKHERLLDPTAEYSQQMNFTARYGLQQCTKCLTFGIVGAGKLTN